jgi:predicted glycogen debranching enzyme
MDNVLHPMPWKGTTEPRREDLLTREWLVTNALGGYASGTVAGVATRRYHGFLIAALPGALGRVCMLNHLTESVRGTDGAIVFLGGEERASGELDLPGAAHLIEFRLEFGLPVWRYQAGEAVIEKRLVMPHLQNTIHITYLLLSGRGPVRLQVRPSVHFRPHEAPVQMSLDGPYVLKAEEDRYELHCAHPLEGRNEHEHGPHIPPLRLKLDGEHASFTLEGRRTPALLYRAERSRGYDSTGELWTPGRFRVDLRPDRGATLIASTDSWETIQALRPEEAFAAEQERRRRLLISAAPFHGGHLDNFAAQMVLAADQFLITPAGRTEESARARAAGDEVRAVIAGYHWFTDWGRDTMISLEGLTLVTGRHAEAGWILRAFGHYVRDGLVPNFFPEGRNEGVYHTADATLWYFHALDRYLHYTGDRETLRQLLPVLQDIVRHHVAGTRFHIGVDRTDGLLHEGQEGYQLTWMDAKVGDWVVTPRRGKAVEINALWYNALRLLQRWLGEEHHEDRTHLIREMADRVYASFNRRFWYEPGGFLYDAIDGPVGDDNSFRPNQILAVSLPYAVLDAKRWPSIVDAVQKRLLTPVGLRSLAPGHPDFKPRYDGDLRSRDAAYHQGTVWAWLIGPFLDAWLRVHPDDRAGAHRLLEGFQAHLGEACLGSISEIFDAEPPFTPRGCIAQAWSVAEVLRCWMRSERSQ